ncbi:hypothetical protein F4805DRAFT_473916 [Annulohypoxylon moriforme]|nr:hypothetical protein F4805DRAFT_473916 [Annulohypoxylon moriforme]
MSFAYSNGPRSTKTGKSRESIAWTKGMELGPGAPHDEPFMKRIRASKRSRGAGTIEDPKVVWLKPGSEETKEEKLRAIENVVRNETRGCGLSNAWIASDAHGFSTTAWKNGQRIMDHDDNHVTLRMGKSADICNLHGHLYLTSEDNDLYKKVTGSMADDERGVRGGKNPQLWVWGRYPPQSQRWPRSQVEYPQAPFDVIPGSILEEQIEAYEKDQELQRQRSTHYYPRGRY